MTASVKPLVPKLIKSRLKVVTMVTTPKSAGVSNLARTTVGTTRSASDSAAADSVAAAPRTASRRSSLPPATGWNAPLASNGIISCPKQNYPPSGSAPCSTSFVVPRVS